MLFQDLLGTEGWQNRLLIICPESAGDCFMITALLEDIKNRFPTKNIYVATKAPFVDIFLDNPFIHRVIPYIEQMENQMFNCGQSDFPGYFDIAYHATIFAQRHLNYLNNGHEDDVNPSIKYASNRSS